MTNVNNFVIIGRLAADAEDFNAGNNTYTSFRLAVNRGQNKDASFIPVRAPRKFISDNLRAKLTKGECVMVSGRFESGSYEKDGQKKHFDHLSATTIQHDVSGNFSEGLLMGNLTADVTTHNTQNGSTMITLTALTRRMAIGRTAHLTSPAPLPARLLSSSPPIFTRATPSCSRAC